MRHPPRLALTLIGAGLLAAIAAAAPGSAAGTAAQAPPGGADTTPPARVSVPFVAETLPNGLTLIVHEDHSVPVVASNIWYHVGSGDERSGRTGFAHLFEHLMFTGSQHAPYPMFDRLLEAAGADFNATTWLDRTNYFETGPVNALPLMLWLESDRMGFFLPTLDSTKVELQRDVVKNERRQRYENQPYGLAEETLVRLLYPKGHPYSWPTIGSMADLSAATVEDVRDFFRRYYAPSNATIVVAGAVRADSVRPLVERYFGSIPRGPAITRPRVPRVTLARDTAAVLQDRVQLPRLHYGWHTVRAFRPEGYALTVAAYVLTGAKNSRIIQPLVYERELATDVSAEQQGFRLDGHFTLTATARPGHSLPELQSVIDGEIRRLADEGPTPRELEQAYNAIEAGFLNSLEQVSHKADQLNAYYYLTGDPDYFAEDLAGFRAVTADAVRRAVRTHLLAPKVVVSVVPQGKTELAAEMRKP